MRSSTKTFRSAGKPTRVFAYYAVPQAGQAPFPAMVLVHGGGGKAFREWAALWADRGYAAIAMDLSGRGPDGKRLPDGGPEQSDDEKFRDFAEADQMWSYDAVAAAVRAHSFLASRPEVDGSRIGVTGISWGGYLTCIIAGIDDRVKVAVPVYGCGFLDENSVWLEPRFKKMGPARAKRWADLFDPSRYLPGVTCPILFVNGTNDFAYPLDSYQKSYQLVKVPTDLCVTVRMPHGHSEGWKPKEIGLFVDSVLKEGTLPPRLAMPEVSGDRVSAPRHDSPGDSESQAPRHDRRRSLAGSELDQRRCPGQRFPGLGHTAGSPADRGVLHGRGRTWGRLEQSPRDGWEMKDPRGSASSERGRI